MIDVSIVIVNYNTLVLTQQTIESVIKKTKGINYEIILVDNNSSDGSKEFFKKQKEDKLKFVESNQNLGFGKANNLGIEKAKGKYIFFLNSDTLLFNNAIKILFDYMEKNPKTGICGGNLYTQEMQPTHSFRRRLTGIHSEFNFIVDKIYEIFTCKKIDFNYTGMAKEVGYITGADLFIRRKILDEVGVFDPDFFMYYEETELTYRVKKAGYNVFSVPDAKIIHLEGKSFKFKEIKFRMSTESKYKYFNKVYEFKEIFLSYIISQCKYLLVPNKKNLTKFKINREEYYELLKNIGTKEESKGYKRGNKYGS